LRVTLIGHSTTLIEITGTRLLTDPYFGRFGHIAYARITPPALARDQLEAPDGVLVSHGHWDHIDRRFLRSLDPSVPVLVPAGSSWTIRLKGARNTVGMRRWQSRHIGNALVTAVPASHIVRTVGFIVQGEGACIYFAGDTFYRPFMAEVGRRFQIDAAMIPVTTYRIPMTMGERAAVKAVRDLRASTVIPIHRGVEPRSPLMRSHQSTAGFIRKLREAGIDASVVVLAPGESWQPGGAAEAQPSTLPADDRLHAPPSLPPELQVDVAARTSSGGPPLNPGIRDAVRERDSRKPPP